MRKDVLGYVLIAVALLFLFGVFVWPTRYAYYSTSHEGIPLVRMDRLSGTVDVYVVGKGWLNGKDMNPIP